MHAATLAVHVDMKSSAFWRHCRNLLDPFCVSLSVCCICLSACAALRQPLSPSLRLFSFLVPLCQLQHCPTYRCLPSLHLTACLKKINISVGREAKASIWCVYLGGRRKNTPHSDVSYLYSTSFSLSLSFYLYLPLFFLIFFFFFCLNPCRRGGVRCVSGQVMGNDTTEQSLNFSQRAGPLILQVAVSFCRQCLNIVAVFNLHGPDIFSPLSAISFCKGDKWFVLPVLSVSVPDVWNLSSRATATTLKGRRRKMLSCLQSFVQMWAAVSLVSALPAR